MSEKRHFSRIAIEGSARLECGERHWQSQLLDVSLKGALIARPAQWAGATGDRCHLEVTLAESDVTIAMEASVAHASDMIVGFRCDQIDIASISHLRRLIELNLGNEDLLERELAELMGQHA